MSISLSRVGQIAVGVDDVDAAEAFYVGVLGLRKLFRFGDLLFVDGGGVRVLIERDPAAPFVPRSSVVYFAVPDIALAFRELTAAGVAFVDAPHRIAPMPDHDLWMVFFRDPAGNLMALMSEAPKGWTPAP